MLYAYEDMKSNYETIKEFCSKFRTELTVIGGVLGEYSNLVDCDEYVKFMNNLTDEEFVGNYLCNLLTNVPDEMYRAILNGDKTFEEFIEKSFDEDVLDAYVEKINE